MNLLDTRREKDLFVQRLNKFIEFTQTEVDKGINPGGYYKAVWTRDAALYSQRSISIRTF